MIVSKSINHFFSDVQKLGNIKSGFANPLDFSALDFFTIQSNILESKVDGAVTLVVFLQYKMEKIGRPSL